MMLSVLAFSGYERELERIGAVDRHGREWRVAEALAARSSVAC